MLYLEEVRNLVSDLSLLVVDDDRLFLENMIDSMNTLFRTVHRAENGLEGLERYRANRGYDIVMTDATMPVKDGLALIREIKKVDRNQPIVLITARHDPVLLNDAMMLGVRHIMLKPVTTEVLLTTLFNVSSTVGRSGSGSRENG